MLIDNEYWRQVGALQLSLFSKKSLCHRKGFIVETDFVDGTDPWWFMTDGNDRTILRFEILRDEWRIVG